MNFKTILLITHHSKFQRSNGISQWLMYILNDDTQNYNFCRLQLVVETFDKIQIKFPKIVRPRKRYHIVDMFYFLIRWFNNIGDF